MTYIEFRRALAHSESLVLRAWACQCRLPVHAPVNYWHEWQEAQAGTPLTWCTPCDRFVQGCDHIDDDIDPDKPDPAVMAKLHETGMSYRKIAARYGVSHDYVHRRLRQEKVPA